MDGEIDWVIAVRQGEANAELRYSLRSIAANVNGIRDIVIAGYKPDWLGNVRHIPVTQESGDKFGNAVRIWRTVAAQISLSDSIVVAHDDFFVMQKIDADMLGPWHCGSLNEHIARIKAAQRQTVWLRSLERSRAWLRGVGYGGKINSFALHLPVIVDRRQLAETYDRLGDDAVRRQIMTIHCALHGIGGTYVARDVKICGTASDPKAWRDWSFLSTKDATFNSHPVGGHIRQIFTEPSIYESDQPGWRPIVRKREMEITDGWVYRNSNTNDVVTRQHRDSRFERLSNWHLIGRPDPTVKIEKAPAPAVETRIWLDYRGRKFEAPEGSTMYDGAFTHRIMTPEDRTMLSQAITHCGRRACPTKTRQIPAPASRQTVDCPECLGQPPDDWTIGNGCKGAEHRPEPATFD